MENIYTDMSNFQQFYLLVAASELSGGQDVGEGAKAMEQHSHKLDDEDEGKEEHKHQTNGLKLQMLLTDEDLGGIKQVRYLLLDISCSYHHA